MTTITLNLGIVYLIKHILLKIAPVMPAFCSLLFPFLFSLAISTHPYTCDKLMLYSLCHDEEAELTKLQMLVRLIPWTIFHVGNLELLGWWNGLSTRAVDIAIINYLNNYVWLCNYTFKNFIISYYKWLGGPWPTLLSRPCLTSVILLQS